jgi:pseudaminic acid cytidylyltransferase
MNLAVIPARGGSQRIPRKNIRNFRGQPIIVRSLEAIMIPVHRSDEQ